MLFKKKNTIKRKFIERHKENVNLIKKSIKNRTHILDYIEERGNLFFDRAIEDAANIKDVPLSILKEVSNEPLKFGDIIGVERPYIIIHYGVYIGNNTVIHFQGDENNSLKNIKIRKDSLNRFLSYGKYKFQNKFFKINFRRFIDNYTLPYQYVFSPDDTVYRALSQLNKTGYKLAFNNCEHFAFWCKFNEKIMTQKFSATDRFYLDYYNFKEEL